MNVQTLFPKKWLSAADLMGRTVTVFIEGCSVEAVFNTRTRKNENKLAVAFHAKQKRLLVNKTQAYALAAACGSPETDNWAGHTVLLSVGVAPNGQETIIVTAAPDAQTNGHAAEPEPEPAAAPVQGNNPFDADAPSPAATIAANADAARWRAP